MVSKTKFKSIFLAIVINFSFCGYTIAQDVFDKSKIENSMIQALEWQEAHPIFADAPTDWTVGAYYVGVARAHAVTKNQIFEAALKNQGYRNNWETYKRVYHADDVAISYSYIYLDMESGRKNLVDLKPTENFLKAHLYKPNSWKEGTDKAPEKNILWWWCDALFMTPPVLNLYAKHAKDETYLDEMHKYYMETYNKLYDKQERLFARDARFIWTGSNTDKKEPNGKKVFWSRGNGWVISGLALILTDMPGTYKHRQFYEKLYLEMSERILELQSKDGLWYTSLLSPDSYNHGEASGSGFHTYALAWGINNGLLDKKKYLPAVKKAWNALTKCQHKNGMIGWVQNIGAFPEPATVDSWQNFGTGAYLLAGSEVLKLKK
ncbi:glycoside hydrolase family 88/105 protein [Flavobacterium faecale]|uniref:glycoside hydrolase family 88/105 protein n=1 Tax=Flavobacterium faecale TaxID=1355330 RepID=UPI003AB02742